MAVGGENSVAGDGRDWQVTPGTPRNAVERDMTAEDRMRETMAASQSLARVYSVMRENKELFGDTSFEDVKAQMELYKA